MHDYNGLIHTGLQVHWYSLYMYSGDVQQPNDHRPTIINEATTIVKEWNLKEWKRLLLYNLIKYQLGGGLKFPGELE